MKDAARRAGLCLAAFLLPAGLFAALGPGGGLVAAAALGALLGFGLRLRGAVLCAAALAAGTAWHGFWRPYALCRGGGLCARALCGVDGAGGVFVRDAAGAVFHAGADGSWERLPLPRGLNLVRVGSGGGLVWALEARAEGDRLWRVGRGTAAWTALGDGVFASDWAYDAAGPVAVDAPGGRLVWVRPPRSLRPPDEAGAPRLVAAGRGGLHVYTAAGSVLSLSPKGNWSVLRLPPPPGLAVSMAEGGGRFTLVMRAERGECAAWDLVGGVSGRWRRRPEAGPCARFAADAERSYSLGRRGVLALPRDGPPSALGPPAAVTRAFERTPVGAFLRLVE